MTSGSGETRGLLAGFTLLEALVAMALMGLILAALATITAQWLPNWNHGIARVQRNEQVALGLERLAADLAAAEFISASRADPQAVLRWCKSFGDLCAHRPWSKYGTWTRNCSHCRNQ